MITLTPYVLLLTGVIVLFFIKELKLKPVIWCLAVYIVTFFLEVVGTRTGFVFGNYTYGNVLGLKLFDVPLIIGFNWVIIIMAAINISQSAEKNIFLAALLASTLTVIFDVILEPVAVKLNYWQWENNIIPLKNYYSWFIITFAASLFASNLKIKFQSIILEHYFMIQLIFFIVLSLFLL